MRILLLCILCLSTITSVVLAADSRLVMDIEYFVEECYCGAPETAVFMLSYIPTFVTGSSGSLVLNVQSAGSRQYGEFHGVGHVLPSGLTFQAGRWDSTTETCRWDSALTDQLRIRHYRGPDAHAEIKFTFSIPDTMAEQFLCVKARWEGSEWGDLASVPRAEGYNARLGGPLNPRPMIFQVRHPCSEADSLHASESRLMESWVFEEWSGMLALAESSLARGWDSFFVLMYAEYAAQNMGKTDLAVQYLDRCYQKHHYVRMLPEGMADSAHHAREYQRMRKELLETPKRDH